MDINALTQKKKRILYFVPQFPVITETFIEREISKLIDFGNLDIQVVSLAKGSGTLSENIKDRVHYENMTVGVCLSAAIAYILLHPIKMWNAHKLVTGKDRVPYLLNLSKKDDARTKLSVLGRFHNSRFVHFLKGIAYAKLFEKYQPDHIHVHFLSDSSTIAMIAAQMLKVPFSVSAHAFDIFVEGSLIATKARVAKFLSICNGNAWQRVVDIANGTGSSGKVRLIYHGIDENKVLQAQPKDLGTDKPVILTIARLVEKKGLDYLIEASKILHDRGIAHKVIIIGKGPLYEQLLAKIKGLELESHVEVILELQNIEVLQYLKSATAFVFSAIQSKEGDMDGVPTGVIEAALAKLPIITTSAGSITDLINEKTGILVPQQDPTAIADAIEKVIYNPEFGRTLGQAAFEKAKEMFNLDKNVGELESLLLG